MATHSSILAWRIPWTEEPNRLHLVHGVTELDTTQQLTRRQDLSINFQYLPCQQQKLRLSPKDVTLP